MTRKKTQLKSFFLNIKKSNLILFSSVFFMSNQIKSIQNSILEVISHKDYLYLNQIKYSSHTNIHTSSKKINIETSKTGKAEILVLESIYLILLPDSSLEFYEKEFPEIKILSGKVFAYSKRKFLLNEENIENHFLIYVNINKASEKEKKSEKKKKIQLEDKKVDTKVLKTIEKDSLNVLKDSIEKESSPLKSNAELLSEINSILDPKETKIQKLDLKKKKISSEKEPKTNFEEKDELNPMLKLELNQSFEK